MRLESLCGGGGSPVGDLVSIKPGGAIKAIYGSEHDIFDCLWHSGKKLEVGRFHGATRGSEVTVNVKPASDWMLHRLRRTGVSTKLKL